MPKETFAINKNCDIDHLTPPVAIQEAVPPSRCHWVPRPLAMPPAFSCLAQIQKSLSTRLWVLASNDLTPGPEMDQSGYSLSIAPKNLTVSFTVSLLHKWPWAVHHPREMAVFNTKPPSCIVYSISRKRQI